MYMNNSDVFFCARVFNNNRQQNKDSNKWGLQNDTGSSVHHFRYEHGRTGTQTTVRLFLFVLFILTVEVVTLTVETPALVRHLAGDPPLFGHCLVQFLAGFVEYFRSLHWPCWC